MKKLGTVYVKACYGRRGQQVMRVKKSSSGSYRYSYSILGDMVSKEVKNFSRLKKVMNKFFADKKVIVQRAIDLIRVKGSRRVDLRAELQRNGNDEIEIVAIPIRVGQSESPITTHGDAFQFDDYVKKLLPDYSDIQIKNLKQEINEFLINVYKKVESEYGKFGEIGIDFALDDKGKIWFIECNAQSAKVSIRKAYGSDVVKKIYLNPLQYAKILAQHRSSRQH
ncbi:hypothetical protein SD70_15405 [Gordoniibacillus kamchatkensis]|uniref:ATP-grasp domain-containing protein n=1 Tax=Gordoniibacillus kamchatkensis TaxID=1590651 RepID=A0ABR5AGL3_9BACL|nr:YheC/YheD family protein [Paenibacillus sp. VKM B-2647]KIL40199.1 hypothetical protein SD70_15405 [Paenibacillus sp. VKM B-2647]